MVLAARDGFEESVPRRVVVRDTLQGLQNPGKDQVISWIKQLPTVARKKSRMATSSNFTTEVASCGSINYLTNREFLKSLNPKEVKFKAFYTVLA